MIPEIKSLPDVSQAFGWFNGASLVKTNKPNAVIKVDSAAFTLLLDVLSDFAEDGELELKNQGSFATLKASIQDDAKIAGFTFLWTLDKADIIAWPSLNVRYPIRFTTMSKILKPVGTQPRNRLFHPSDMPQYTVVFRPSDGTTVIKERFEPTDLVDNDVLTFKNPSLIDEGFSPIPTSKHVVSIPIDVEKLHAVISEFKEDGQKIITLLPGKESTEFRGSPFVVKYGAEGAMRKGEVKLASLPLGSGFDKERWSKEYELRYARYYLLEKKVLEGTVSLSEVADFTQLDEIRKKYTYWLKNMSTITSFCKKAKIEQVDLEMTEGGLLIIKFEMAGVPVRGQFMLAQNEGFSNTEFTSTERFRYLTRDPQAILKTAQGYAYLQDKWIEELTNQLVKHYNFDAIEGLVKAIRVKEKGLMSEEEKKEYGQDAVAFLVFPIAIPKNILESFKMEPAEKKQAKAKMAALSLNGFFEHAVKVRQSQK